MTSSYLLTLLIFRPPLSLSTTTKILTCARYLNRGDLIISGDCGGTNTRLTLWLIPTGSVAFKGSVAPGEITFAKKYHNENYGSFPEVCHLFMKEAKLVDRLPVACVLACAGPILNNTVEYVPFFCVFVCVAALFECLFSLLPSLWDCILI